MLIDLKKKELQTKFEVKNNLNEIFSAAIDDRKSNWDQYFGNLSKIYNKELAGESNLRTFVHGFEKLSDSEKRTIFALHNSASND
jgi:hypothetical protein